ncbi:MAG: T9SS type A sorting domain-containing protein [Prevotellaceae bacterium]|jgi:hypothetical protein|nr:T9SS type A sorting domain-containing protein [Prevotellaceae bacterium]
MKKIYFLLSILTCAAINIVAQRTVNLNDEKSGLTSLVPAMVPQEFLAEAKMARVFTLNPVLQKDDKIQIGDVITLQLFENEIYTSQISKIATDINGNFTVMLRLPEYPMAYGFITTSAAGKSLFSLTVPELDKIFASRGSIYSDVNYLLEIDKNSVLKYEGDGVPVPEGIMINAEGDAGTMQKHLAPQATADNCNPASLGPNDPANIDILIVYTPAAKVWADANENGISNAIAGAMAHTEAVLANQGNNDLMTCVHSELIDYEEHIYDMGLDLNNLTGTADGYMDNVHRLRKQYEADIVALIALNSNTGGLGWVLSNSNGNYSYAFNVVRVQQASLTNTSIHEIGHNMGMLHNKEDNNITNHFCSYAHGWHWTGNDNKEYGSVMSYIGMETPYFSNPAITFNGAPTGNSATANNAQVFRNTKHVTAFYSDKLANMPDAPTDIVVSNPTNGGATFSWDAMPNVTEYRVCVYITGNSGTYYYYPTTNTTLTFNNTGIFSACTTYYFMLQAINECNDAVNSATMPFKTKCDTDPTVTALATTDITMNSATLNKTVVNNGTAVTAEGFKYKKTSDTGWQTSATGALSGLDGDTEYKFYAYATTATGTFNSNVLTFRTCPTTLQYDISPAIGAWQLISTPFADAPLSKFKFDMQPRVALYELDWSPTASDWKKVEGSTLPLGKGIAYLINNSVGEPMTNYPTNGLITFEGEANTANVSANVVTKYALLGNPFNSTIELGGNVVGAIKTGGWYKCSADGKTFPLQVMASVPAWQGFIVENQNPSQTADVTITLGSLSPAPAQSALFDNALITITTANNGLQSSAYVKNNANGSATVGSSDMSFLNMGANEYVQVYTVKNDDSGAAHKLALNVVNTEQATIPVGILTQYSGDITLTLTGMNTYDCNVALTDLAENKYYHLSGLADYEIETTVSGSSETRFELVLSPKIPDGVENLVSHNIQAFVSNGKIQIRSGAGNPVQNVKVYSVSGALVATRTANSAETEIEERLPAGAYLLKIQTVKETKMQKIVISD